MFPITMPRPASRSDERIAWPAPPPAPAAPQRATGQPQLPLAAQPAVPYAQVALQALIIWLAVRVIFALISYLALVSIVPGSSASAADLFTSWNQWDARWYVGIASAGYTDPTQAAFFPLFPLLIRLVMLFVGQDHAFLAGVIVANACAFLAFFGLGLVAANEDRTLGAGTRAILAMAAYPFAFFLATSYTEAPFLACAIFAVYCARRGRWLPAVLLSFLATLTRSDGVLLVLPLGWEYLRQHVDWPALRAWALAFREIGRPRSLLKALRRRRPAAVLAVRDLRQPGALAGLARLIAAPLAAIGVYMLFLGLRFGQPLAFVTAQHANPQWGRTTLPPWQTARLAWAQLTSAAPGSWPQAQVLLDLVPLALVLVLVLLAIRRLPFSFILYTLGVVYYAMAAPAPAATSMLMSARRIMLGAFPIFVQLGRWMERRPWLQALVLGGGFAVESIMVLTFITGRWAG